MVTGNILEQEEDLHNKIVILNKAIEMISHKIQI